MRVLRQCKVPRAEKKYSLLTNVKTFAPQRKKWTRHEHAQCFQLGYESLRLLIADQYEVFRPPACFVLSSHCTKNVYTPQGSSLLLWTLSPHPFNVFQINLILSLDKYNKIWKVHAFEYTEVAKVICTSRVVTSAGCFSDNHGSKK
jgi:hypothetical protein